MKEVLFAAAVFLTTAAVADRGIDPHQVNKKAGKASSLPPTLRDALELEEILYEREPGFFTEADRAKRALVLGRVLPSLAADRTVPDAARERLSALDPAAATQLVDGTSTARDNFARKALAEGDVAPRASARSQMYVAAAQNDVPVLDASKTTEQWLALQARTNRKPAANSPTETEGAPAGTQERGLFERGKPRRNNEVF